MEVEKKEHRRTINVFVLAMLCMAVVISLRNLPLTSTYGLSSAFYYLAAALLFMIPYALVSAELASGWPKGGGVYIWVREALGERWGFFAIWMQWFHNMTWYPAMLSFISAGIGYVCFPGMCEDKIYITTVIIIGFWIVTFLNFLGIKTSAWVSSAGLILGTIIPGALLIAFAIFWLTQGHPTQISFEASHLIPEFKLSNLIFLAGIFLALSGLEANANLAREVKNPKRNYPKAIFIAALLTLSILIFGSIAIAMVIPKGDISLIASLLSAFSIYLNLFHLGWLVPVVILFIVLGGLAELNAWAIAGIKGLFVTTENGSLPPFFHKLNKNNIPTRLLLFQAIIVTFAAFIFVYMPNINVSYWVLSAISAQMYIVMYILLFIAGVVLRYRKPEVERVYKIPVTNFGITFVSVIGIASALLAFFFSFFPPVDFETGNIWVYEIMMLAGFFISCAIPLIIYANRKPHWKVEIAQKIREDIQKGIH